MVKRGGTKRKIPMEKITKKLSIPPTFTKRRDGLFSKASQLCLLSGAQIAVLATPPSSESNVSFYSFGHSSVDSVVSAYLSGQRPLPVREGNNKETREDVGVCLTREDLGLGNWWEDESLNRSENPEELRHAMDSMWTLLSDLKDLKKKKEKIDAVVLDNGAPDQTLVLQSTTFPEICCIPDDDDDAPKNYTEEHCRINDICESVSVSDYNNTLPQGNNNAALPEGGFDYGQEDIDIENLIDFDYILGDTTHLEEVATNLQSTTNSPAVCCIPDDDENYTEEQNQINEICGSFAVSDNNITLPQGNDNNAALPDWDCNQEMMDFEQLLDFETPSEIAFNDYGFEKTTHLDLEDLDFEEAAASILRNSDDHVSYLKDFEKMISAILPRN